MRLMGIQSTKDEFSDFSRLGNYPDQKFGKNFAQAPATPIRLYSPNVDLRRRIW